MEHAIQTDRLLLRPLGEPDIPFLLELSARPEYFQYDSGNAQPSEEVAKRCHWFMERAQKLPTEGAIQWIALRDGVKIGEAHVICNWEETSEWEIGWHFLREHWGRGFATEAAKAAIQYSFAHFSVNRLAAFLNAENERSAALAQRAGMLREGRMRETRLIHGVFYDEYVYSVLRRDVAPLATGQG